MSWLSRHPQRWTGRATAPGRAFHQRDHHERWSRHAESIRIDSGRRVLIPHSPALHHPEWAGFEAGEPSHSLLLVEDDDFGRETLSSILRADGYRVLAAANGDEAVAHLHGDYRPDLVILDLVLPRTNGWSLIEEQEDDLVLAGLPVIIVSAADPRTQPAAPAGIVAWFEKPIAVGDLLAAIRHNLK
jgi:CheY-like chemotaxis protein